MTKNKGKKLKIPTLTTPVFPQGAPGGLKPPKLKTEDAEKTYVQRPVEKEEFRPKQAYVPPTAHRRNK
eukprot:scaffold25760_cov39-Prasinocladus_malaysianus.AAC.1